MVSGLGPSPSPCGSVHGRSTERLGLRFCCTQNRLKEEEEEEEEGEEEGEEEEGEEKEDEEEEKGEEK